MGGVYRIQTFFGFLYIFYIYKAPKCDLLKFVKTANQRGPKLASFHCGVRDAGLQRWHRGKTGYGG